MKKFNTRNIAAICLVCFCFIFCLVNLAHAQCTEGYYKEGLNYGIGGDFDKALECMKKQQEKYKSCNHIKQALKIIKDVKDNKASKETAVLLFDGIAYLDGNDPDKAEAAFQRAISFEDKYAVSHFLLGRVYIDKRMLDKAEEEFKKAIFLNPQDYMSYFYLGDIYLDRDLPEKSLAEFKKSADIDKEFDMVHWGLGKAYEKKGMLKEAVAEYKKAIELDPSESIYYYALYRVCKDNNMTDEAFAEYKKIISLNSNNEVARACLAAVYEEKGMDEEAILEYKKAIELNPKEGEYYNSLLSLYIKKSDYKSAAEYYNKAVKNDILIYTDIEDKIKESGFSLDPWTAYDFFQEGLRRAIAGDFENAEKNFKESYKYWKDVNKLNDCLKVIEKLKGNKVKKEAAVCFFKGIFYEKSDKSVAEFQKAADVEPSFAPPYYYLGNIYYDEDKLDKSLEEFKKFVSIDPDNAFAHRFLGLIYYKKNMPDDAIVEFKKCIEIDPDLIIVKINLIGVYIDKRLYDEAISMAQDVFGSFKSGGESPVESYLKITEEYLCLGTYSTIGRICFSQSKSSEESGILFEKAVCKDSEENSIKNYLKKLGKAYYCYNKAIECGANADFEGCKKNLEEALKIEKDDRMAESYLKITEEALNNKKYGEFAVHIFRGILYNLKGMKEDVYFEMIKAAKAAKDSEFASDAAEAYSLMLRAYFEKFLNDMAIVKINEKVLKNPNDAEMHYNLGSAYHSKGLIDDAIPEYKKAIAINPNNEYYHSSLAGAYVAKDIPDEAISEYKKALDINPGDLNLHRILAEVYHKKGMLDEAISEYKKDIEISGGDERVYYDLACVYRDKGMLDESIAIFEKALKHGDYAYIHYGLAEVYFKKGEYQLAIKHCDEAVKQGYSKTDPKFLEELKPYRKQ